MEVFSMILRSPHAWFTAVLLLASSNALLAHGQNLPAQNVPGGYLPCFRGCPASSSSNPAANILSRYSEAQDAINNTFNQFRSILLTRETTRAEGTYEGIDVPENDNDSDRRIDADIERMRIEQQARQVAEAARRLEEERNQEAANLLRDANNLLQSADSNVDCAALMSTYYSGNPPALPPQCMSDAERMSVYTPGSPRQLANLASPEPVIDGSNIPSAIDFNPVLQQLTSQIASASSNDDATKAAPLESLVNGIQTTDQGSPSTTSSSALEEGTSSQSADQAQGPSVLDQLRDTAIKDWDTVKQAGQLGAEFSIDQAPKAALKLTDEERSVMIPDPAVAGASSLIRSYGLPSAISNILGNQIANSLESKLLNLGTNWEQVNADPNGKDALDFSRAQAPYKVYQLYDYPTGILKVLDNKLGNFSESPQGSTSGPNQ
jgi:hypothetical protein